MGNVAMRMLSLALALALLPLAFGTALASTRERLAEQPQPLLSAAQLDQLVAPIALYPDTLLAQVLMASTYPLGGRAGRPLCQSQQGPERRQADPGARTSRIGIASVKQLVSTPTVLAMMSDQLDWTEKLGDAVLAQQADVMDAIQRLRAEAQANGKLETTKQQKVTVNQEANKQVIEIEPASPECRLRALLRSSGCLRRVAVSGLSALLLSPACRATSYGGAIASGLAWGAAFAIGNEIWDNFDWDRGDINVNIDRNVNRNAERNFTEMGAQLLSPPWREL